MSNDVSSILKEYGLVLLDNHRTLDELKKSDTFGHDASKIGMHNFPLSVRQHATILNFEREVNYLPDVLHHVKVRSKDLVAQHFDHMVNNSSIPI